MEIHIIAVVGSDLSIGRNGDLIRHLPEDLRHFKQLTSGSAVIMGRKTWQSLPRRPLPGRLNIIVSRQPDYAEEGAITVTSIEAAIRAAEAAGHERAYIIGGGEIYRQSIGIADVLDLTEVDAACPDADTHFPPYTHEWLPTATAPGHPTADQPSYTFITYRRR